jgi:hypothetical protein
MAHWDTNDEINYILHIGSASGLVGSTHTRLELLEAYFTAALKRQVWAGIDSDRVLQVCIAQIERERGSRPAEGPPA